jgi:hypothetical protein
MSESEAQSYVKMSLSDRLREVVPRQVGALAPWWKPLVAVVGGRGRGAFAMYGFNHAVHELYTLSHCRHIIHTVTRLAHYIHHHTVHTLFTRPHSSRIIHTVTRFTHYTHSHAWTFMLGKYLDFYAWEILGLCSV